jgi:hypothetical protein
VSRDRRRDSGNSHWHGWLDGPLFPLLLPRWRSLLSRGVGGNAEAGGGVDINFRPDHSGEFSLTVQRALSQKLLIEAGYIGRIIRDEYQLVNIDAVPTMTTLDGQSFANAFVNLYQEVRSS